MTSPKPRVANGATHGDRENASTQQVAMIAICGAQA